MSHDGRTVKKIDKTVVSLVVNQDYRGYTLVSLAW